MNCEIAHERIVTAEYGELGDEQTQELERHIAGCPDCAAEREQMLALKALAEMHPVEEPSANLVARARMRLDEALDALPPRRWYERLGQRVRNNVAGLQAAPVAACLLLLIGAGAGSLGSYEIARNRGARTREIATVNTPPQTLNVQTQAQAPPQGAPAEIANVSSVVRKPNSHLVEVHYNQLVPQKIEGSLDDPAIRQLLMVASQSSASAGVRGDSVALLADECKAGHSCQAAGIRAALMATLRYDKNAAVREKALNGLEPYVAQDVRVRDAVLEALMNDAAPKIRTAALNILEPVEGDTSVRQVLHSVADTDENPYIRTVSRQVLSREPEIQ
ncbi:MAG: anti-sigma factor family protein [Terracidiphilus sp.]